MKKQLILALFIVLSITILSNSVIAQQCSPGGCTVSTKEYPKSGAPYTPPPTWQVLINPENGKVAQMNAGNYTRFKVEVGNTYEWTYCEEYKGVSTSWDAQLTLSDSSNPTVPLCFSVDGCGDRKLAPYISWKATFTGTVQVLSTYFASGGCKSNVGMTSYNNLAYRQLSGTTCTTPGTPASATATPISQTSASLSWTAGNPVGSPPVTYYWVVGTNPSVTYETGIANGTANGTSFTTSALTCGTTYYLRVYAKSSCDGSISGYRTSSPFTTSACSGSSGSSIEGIDIRGDKVVDKWVNVADDGVKFAYLKATESTRNPVNFIDNAKEAVKYVSLGMYHFGTPLFSAGYYQPSYNRQTTAIAEADNFVTAAKNYIGKGFLPPALDIEDQIVSFTSDNKPKAYVDPLTGYSHDNAQPHPNRLPDQPKMSPAALAQWIHDWTNEVYLKTGVMPILYCSKYYADALYQYYLNKTITCKLWIATVGDPAGKPDNHIRYQWEEWPWIFHQYSQSGSLTPELIGDVDLDRFYGDEDALNKLKSGDSAPALPDLNIIANTQIVNPTTVTAGNNITVSCLEHVAGPVGAGPNDVTIWLSTDDILNKNNDVNLGKISFPGLSANTDSKIGTATVQIPATTAAGRYYVYFWADGNEVIAESDEDHNFSSVIINVNKVLGCTSPPPIITSEATNITTTSFHTTWNSSKDATSYHIDVSTDDFKSFVPGYHDRDVGNVTFADITGLSCSTGYYYRVRGYNDCSRSIDLSGLIALTSDCSNPYIPPANDVCSGSVPELSVGTTISYTSGDIAHATQSYPATTNCPSALVQDVWYKFTATSNGTYTVKLAPSSGMDGIVEVREGSCTGNVLRCSDAGGGSGNEESLPVLVTSGQTYYVRVYEFNKEGNHEPPSTTTFNIGVVSPAACIAPAQPTITANGATAICPGSSVTLTANGCTNCSYLWSPGNQTDQSITASQAGDYTVTVSNGCSPSATSLPISISLNQPITPSVIIEASTSTTICSGQPVTFTPTPTSAGANPVYQWKVDNAIITTGPTFTTTSLTNGQTLRCVMTSDVACLGTIHVESNAITMTVNSNSATPVVAISITAGSNQTCQGQSVTFTASPTNEGANPTYQWKADGVDVWTGPVYSTSSLTNGQVVSCIMISDLPCGRAISFSNSILMSVEAAIAPSVIIALTSGTNPTCSNKSVTFAATPTNGGTNPTYQWTVDNTVVGTGPAYTTSTLTNGQIVGCIMTSDLRCTTSPSIASNTIPMTVNTITVDPSVTIAITAGGNPTCQGQTVSFIASSKDGGTNPSYVWNIGEAIVEIGPVYSSSTLVDGQVITCTMTSDSPCGPILSTSNAIIMSIGASVTPTVSIALTSGSIPTCGNQPLTFTASPFNAGANPTYQWKVDGVDVWTGSVYATSTLTDGQMVSCTMMYNLPCSAANEVSSNAIGITVTNLPDFSITPVGSTTFATGGYVTLTAPAASGYAYQWLVNGTIIPGFNESTFLATESGSYTVKISLNGCEVTSEPMVVTSVFTLPVANFTLTATSESCKASNNGSISIAAAQPLNYIATITGNNNPYKFTDKADINNLSAGTYTVCITVEEHKEYNQCYDIVISEPADLGVYVAINHPLKTVKLALTGSRLYQIELNGTAYATSKDEITLPIITGKNHLKVTADKLCQGVFQQTFTITDGILIYPNPFEHTLTINLGLDKSPIVGIEIYDINGKIVYAKQAINEDGLVHLNSLPDLILGTYTLKLKLNTSESVYKILRQ